MFDVFQEMAAFKSGAKKPKVEAARKPQAVAVMDDDDDDDDEDEDDEEDDDDDE